MQSYNIASWFEYARRQLIEDGDHHSLELEILVAHILSKSRSWVIAHPDIYLPPQIISQLNGLLTRLANGEPLPYLIGHWEFYGLDFKITPDVLIPRPETELMVETALKWIAHQKKDGVSALDVGTGSGCIAITIAHHCHNTHFLAMDISFPALRIAQKNISRNKVTDQVSLIQANFLESLHTKFDLICANLPYIPSRTLTKLPISRFEPRIALDGGPDGLFYINSLLKMLPSHLTFDGLALLEIESSQGEMILDLCKKYSCEYDLQIINDLAGHQRLAKLTF
jgi:release factor glutamine methyltransferase